MSATKPSRGFESFFKSLCAGDTDAVLGALANDITLSLPTCDRGRIVPYFGTKRGKAQVAEAFKERGETTNVKTYELCDLIVQDRRACALIFADAACRATGKSFDGEELHWVLANEAGEIVQWRVSFDPTDEIEAFCANLDLLLIAAVRKNDVAESKRLLGLGGDPNARCDESGLNVLMMAAGQANVALTKLLLEAGADPFTVDTRGGASPLHKACQGGNAEVARLLLEAGILADTIAPTTGHTALVDALWYKYPDAVECLLEHGATLNLSAHYGFSLQQHIDFEDKVTKTGRDRLIRSIELVAQRRRSDEAKVQSHKLIDAVNRDDIDAVRQLIKSRVDVDMVFPLVNGFNDGHTALLVAARDGHTAIVAELLKAGANVNAIEPTFGAVPLHKAVYNGHAEITRLLVAHPGINLDYQGVTNGYTSLHDALWHGFAECAEILVRAGARLDILGHDGKSPLDMAIENLGSDHPVTELIRSKVKVKAKTS